MPHLPECGGQKQRSVCIAGTSRGGGESQTGLGRLLEDGYEAGDLQPRGDETALASCWESEGAEVNVPRYHQRTIYADL